MAAAAKILPINRSLPRSSISSDPSSLHNLSLFFPALSLPSCSSNQDDSKIQMPFERRRISRIVVHAVRDESVTTHGNVITFEDGELQSISINTAYASTAAALEKCIEEAGNKLVVLDISTKTCGPCRLIYPKVVKMSLEYPDVLFLKINGDHDSSTRALMRKWGIRAVPSFRFYKNGKMIHSHSGAKEDDLRSYFLSHYVNVSV